MIPVLLTSIRTRDGVSLHGIIVRSRQKSATALIWIHGLGSNFSGGQALVKELSARCTKNGITYFKFNTRGHDSAHRDTRKKKGLHGSGFERFTDCVPDIRAMITEARRLGYRKLILAGHSTGANKALYYLLKTSDPAVKGLLVLGPVNDIAAGRKKFGAVGLTRGVALAEKLAKKNPMALMPQKYGIVTAQRFLSMFRAGGTEDTFPYLDPRADWKALKSVRVPVAAVFGQQDEYLDRPAKKIIEIFRANAPLAKSFTGAIIKGADHGFKGKEKELADAIIRFVKRAIV